MTDSEIVALFRRAEDFIREPGSRDTALSLLADLEAAIKTIEGRKNP